MTNTYAELNEEVATLLHETLHGRTVDMMQSIEPQLEHMLGYTPIGEPVRDHHCSGTLVDPDHEFWDNYKDTIETTTDTREELITSIRILDDKGLFRIDYPYGREGGIAFIEVEKPSDTSHADRASSDLLSTKCFTCGAAIHTAPEIRTVGKEYVLVVPIDCPNCSFQEEIRTSMMQNP